MAQTKKTLVLGASGNPARYSYLAINKLRAHGHPVEGIGLSEVRVSDIDIRKDKPTLEGVDTVTLYLSAAHQREYYDYILSLKPKRIIFNPGAENDELADLAKENNIYPQEACTLVLLSTGQY
jgi:predicted CoA-binding protein